MILGVIYVPKGLQGSAQGFNPGGTLKINEFALKGREANLMKPASIVAPKIRVRN
jgi:hypothetical protein